MTGDTIARQRLGLSFRVHLELFAPLRTQGLATTHRVLAATIVLASHLPPFYATLASCVCLGFRQKLIALQAAIAPARDRVHQHPASVAIIALPARLLRFRALRETIARSARFPRFRAQLVKIAVLPNFALPSHVVVGVTVMNSLVFPRFVPRVAFALMPPLPHCLASLGTIALKTGCVHPSAATA